MGSDAKSSPFKNGYWTWDENAQGLMFVSREFVPHISYHNIRGASNVSSSYVPSMKCQEDRIIFRDDTIDSVEQAKYRRLYQRKVKPTEEEVVTIQDLKDVAIFMAEPEYLTVDFIKYFHTVSVDRFLRSLIIYFQYYFQVWAHLMARRQESQRKLRQPIVEVLENITRDNLADLRSMVAMHYGCIIMGIGDSKRFHHMNNRNNVSLSDKERRLFESFIVMATKVVWLALHRKSVILIEAETNRLLRTKLFSPMAHSENVAIKTNAEEDRVLLGKAYEDERTLKHRSPAIQELIFDDHDYRMLLIGILDTGSHGERLEYLEAAYAAPEEMLNDMDIGIGILGTPRAYYDPMLKPKEISTTQKRSIERKPIPEFRLPPKEEEGGLHVDRNMPRHLCKYKEPPATIRARKFQRQMWVDYIKRMGEPPPTTNDAQSSQSGSHRISVESNPNKITT